MMVKTLLTDGMPHFENMGHRTALITRKGERDRGRRDQMSWTVMMDSGVRRGTDVLKALALGAQFVFVGRPFLYAAAIGSEAGVRHAIKLLQEEVTATWRSSESASSLTCGVSC